jgi:hypothetical protein
MQGEAGILEEVGLLVLHVLADALLRKVKKAEEADFHKNRPT